MIIYGTSTYLYNIIIGLYRQVFDGIQECVSVYEYIWWQHGCFQPLHSVVLGMLLRSTQAGTGWKPSGWLDFHSPFLMISAIYGTCRWQWKIGRLTPGMAFCACENDEPLEFGVFLSFLLKPIWSSLFSEKPMFGFGSMSRAYLSGVEASYVFWGSPALFLSLSPWY